MKRTSRGQILPQSHQQGSSESEIIEPDEIVRRVECATLSSQTQLPPLASCSRCKVAFTALSQNDIELHIDSADHNNDVWTIDLLIPKENGKSLQSEDILYPILGLDAVLCLKCKSYCGKKKSSIKSHINTKMHRTGAGATANKIAKTAKIPIPDYIDWLKYMEGDQERNSAVCKYCKKKVTLTLKHIESHKNGKWHSDFAKKYQQSTASGMSAATHMDAENIDDDHIDPEERQLNTMALIRIQIEMERMHEVATKEEFKLHGIAVLLKDLKTPSYYCTLCNELFEGNSKQIIQKHISTNKHLKYVPDENQLTPEGFHRGLATSFVAADIPVTKIKNESLKKWIETYTRQTLFSDSTYRKKYIPQLHIEIQSDVRELIANNFIWVSLDATKDSMDRQVLAFIVGTLTRERLGPFFVHSEQVTASKDSKAIKAFFERSLNVLYPDVDPKVYKRRILVCVTDAGSDIVKAIGELKRECIDYEKMVFVTCLCHGICRITKKFPDIFKATDNLIMKNKALYSKAPERRRLYDELYPAIKQVPRPVDTRWGTWLFASKFYSVRANFDAAKDVAAQIRQVQDEEKNRAIREANAAFAVDGLFEQVASIHENLRFAAYAIKDLETANLQLENAIDIAEDTFKGLRKIKITNYPVPDIIEQTVDYVRNKNKGYLTLFDWIKRGVKTNELVNYSDEELLALEYAPISSAAVERVFSHYKAAFRTNRKRFLFVNLVNHVMSKFNVPMLLQAQRIRHSEAEKELELSASDLPADAADAEDADFDYEADIEDVELDANAENAVDFMRNRHEMYDDHDFESDDDDERL